MKFHSETQKDEDEELLKTDTAHVNMHTFKLLGHGCRRTCITPADDLDDEGDEVESNEGDCEDGGRNREDGVRGEVKMDHASENHVCESVDPCF